MTGGTRPADQRPGAGGSPSETAPAPAVDFRSVVDSAADAVIVIEVDPADAGSRIVYVNPAFTRLTGYSAGEAVGKSPRMLQGAETSAEAARAISAAIHSGGAIRRRLLNYRKDGRIFWVEISIAPLPGGDRHPGLFAAIEREVTDEIRRERELEALASADPLTRLLTRRAGDAFLAREFARARRNGLAMALAILDIDHLKSVNDRYGHHVGDRVLSAFADVLRETLRSYDCAARIGGDEFMVVLPGTDRADALQVVDRVLAGVRRKSRVAVDHHRVGITCSAGLTSLGSGDRSAQALLRRADRALYLAKREGRDRLCEFDCGEGAAKPV
jgi:diguanylate cyclase (GGDEF)-like protein/PAS domain S-box-containing protein